MDCKRTDELLVDFLYGELDQGGRAGFERHLAGCPACAREIEQLQGVLALVRAQPADEPSEQVSERILHAARTAVSCAAEQQRLAARPSWLRWLVSPAAVSAVLAVIVVSVGLVTYLGSRPTPEPVTVDSEVQSIAPPAPHKPQNEALQRARPAEEKPQVAARPTPEDLDTSLDEQARPEPAPSRGQIEAQPVAAGKVKIRRKTRPAPAVGRLAKDARADSLAGLRPVIKPADGDRGPAVLGGGAGPAAGEKAGREIQRPERPGPFARPPPPGRASGSDGAPPAEPERVESRFAVPPPRATEPAWADPKRDKEAKKKAAHTAPVKTPAPAPDAAYADQAPKEEAMVAESEGAFDLDDAKSIEATTAYPARTAPATRAATRQGSSSVDQYTLAERALARGEHDAAATGFRAFIAANPVGPRTITARFRLAKALFLAGRCEQAIRAADVAFRFAPHHRLAADALFDQASCYVKLGRFEKAISTYRLIERQHPIRAPEARRAADRLTPSDR